MSKFTLRRIKVEVLPIIRQTTFRINLDLTMMITLFESVKCIKSDKFADKMKNESKQ